MSLPKTSYTEEELKQFQALKASAIEAAEVIGEDALEDFAEEQKEKERLNENKS